MASPKKSVDNRSPKVENHLIEKRNELIWALDIQDYTDAQIGRIFNIRHRSTVKRIIARRPPEWKPKWQKVQD